MIFKTQMKNILVIFLFLLPFLTQAQTVLKGTAYDADKRSKLNLVFVNNLTQREADHSGQKGDFVVNAIFSGPDIGVFDAVK